MSLHRCIVFLFFISIANIVSATNAANGAERAPLVGAENLHPRLIEMLSTLSRNFDRQVIVTSGCRSANSNRRAGGAKRSYHLRCMAADFRIAGISEIRALAAVKTLRHRGGVGTYCRNSVVHLDVGPRREWHQKCRRSRTKLAKLKAS
jgi:uncharacterized protein YcbK (DUF882 family)